MVKRVLYMLVLAITLQLSWSVAAGYCMHESGKASQHFGHHQHEHVADDDTDHNGSTLAKKKVGSDPDCASCSHSPASATSLAAENPAPFLAAHAVAAVQDTPSEPYLGPPERPQWIVAA